MDILLDASAWLTWDDFYDALLPQLGAPDWHGRNLNAVDDSLVFGGINEREPPFRFRLIHVSALPAAMRDGINGFVEIVQRGRDQYGVDLDIEIEGEL